jgi:hypothetical protein
VHAVAVDAQGEPLPDKVVTFQFTPEDAVTHSGDALTFTKEGPVVFSWHVGEIVRTVTIEVVSPLLGEFERTSQPSKGMRVKIRRLGDELVGEISRVALADEEAITWTVENVFGEIKAPAAEKRRYAEKRAQCFSEAFAVGLRKMQGITRLEADTWEAESLSLEQLSAPTPGQPCPRVKSEYGKMTIVREADGTLGLADIKSADAASGAKQRWVRVRTEVTAP